MPRTAPFRCFLIGADTLLVACGDVLLQRGHEIAGVLTRTARVADWARSNGIPVHDTKDTSALAAEPFDYLFAITHLAILKDEVLELAQHATINFHDGPLPRYAGLNAPAWALMAGEREYGITWHVVTTGVDEGDVLQSRTFDVAPDENSLTLNTKCFEAGLDGFQQLVDELAEGRETRSAQDASRRTYFGKHKKPSAACALDWSLSADELAAFMRALDFGRYDNPLGAAKLWTGERVLLATAARAHDEASDAAPGTVLGSGAEGVHVACGRGVLRITGLATTSGREVPLASVAASELSAGKQLALAPRIADLLDARAEAVSRSEAFWVRRLARLEPLEIPYARAPKTPGTERAPDEVPVTVPATFRDRYAGDADTLAFAVAAYLARIGGKRVYDLAFREAGPDATLAQWFSPEVPLRVDVDTSLPFDEACRAFTEELALLRTKAPWLRDVAARYAELPCHGASDDERLLPVVIDVHDGGQREPKVDLITFVLSAKGSTCRILFDTTRISLEGVEAMREQLEVFLGSIAAEPARDLARHDVLTADVRQAVLYDWNCTATGYNVSCIHEQIEEQVELSPERTAVLFEGASLTYRELDERANRLAAHLVTLGAGPECLIGICVERSLDLIVAVLGTLKAGAAYVPLDPSFPADRIAYMVEDAGAPILIAQDALVPLLPESQAVIVRIDTDRSAIDAHPAARVEDTTSPANLAYVMYTSGSTGRPKGVMVEHGNVANFFAGMDERVPRDGAHGTWMAVTSLSFDISVLELLWTLARGFEVVVYLDRDRSRAVTRSSASRAQIAQRPMDFSLFYFSSDAEEGGDTPYRLLLEGARFGDEHGFAAVWTPERHFHRFGGSYPAPAVTAAAVAATTKRIGIRSGSVVLPLHHPIRVAESWSVVDNLSNGRVGLAFASGWQPNDFILAPESYGRAKEVMFEHIETFKRLWRGESVPFEGPAGPFDVTTLPRPIQAEAPIWITTAGNPETYERAGRIGANILTHLLGQSVEDLAPKIALYRRARAEAGFDPQTGTVSLMLHTFVGQDDERVRETVRGPLRSYLAGSMSLLEKYAWSFPVYSKANDEDPGDEFASLTEEEREAMLDHAFERYYETSGMFGTPETCLERVDELKAIDVDEIACLIDFGVPTEEALAGLEQLDRVRTLELASREPASEVDVSFAAQVKRHGVTHMQCTPSMARMLVANDETRAALGSLRHVMIGGEAFPPDLATELQELVRDSVTNMYGPTETTIWSATWRVPGAVGSVPIGHPIANTSLYVLDENREPLPPGDASCPIRLKAPPRRDACTARAISPACVTTARSSSSAAPTTRSRSAATASSWARSRRSSRVTTSCARRSLWLARRTPGTTSSSPMSCPKLGRSRRTYCASSCARPCPSTWCRPASCRSTRCR